MKKVILSLAVVAMALSFTSCKKCGQCVESDGYTSAEICQKDNKIIYDLVKKACKEDGGKWE